jgi:predicted double-glycine peptidase
VTALAQTILTILLAAMTGWLGWHLRRANDRLYWAAISLSFLVILSIGAVWWAVLPVTVPGLAWLGAGQHKLIAFAMAGPLLQVSLLSKLKKRTERILVGVFLAIIIGRVSVLPPLMAALAVPELSRIKTDVDTHGICMQTTSYTSGPAAAVTLLRRLGIRAQEGELAILTGTSMFSGTDPETLTQVINDRYGSQGVVAQYRVFTSLAELRAAGPALVVITLPSGLDHYVAVLEVNDRQVVTADPLLGGHPFWHQAFILVWHFNGIVIYRRQTGKI